MNTYKLIAVGTAALGMAYGQTATAGELATGAVSGATNLAKGAASSTLSGAKSLLSMPGKALSFGNDALPDLSAGTQEFGLGGNVSFGDDIIYNLNLSYGYFFKDNWEVGFDATVQGVDSDLALSVGLFTEYNFDLGSKWVPYIGASIGLASISSDGSAGTSDDLSSLSLAGELGVKYFIRENIALVGSIDYAYSFKDADDIDLNAGNVNIGTRFYF